MSTIKGVDMSTVLKELVSPSGKYKAVIKERDDCNNIDVFVLSEDYDPTNDCSYGLYWSQRNTTSIFVDKNKSAVHFAIEELRMLIGEPKKPISIDWIRDYSFNKDAVFIDPKEVNVFYEFVDPVSKEQKSEKIEIRYVIKISDYFLVEEVGDEDNWQVGNADSTGDIHCWTYYGTLKDAIRAL
jgi:hypothetical protein